MDNFILNGYRWYIRYVEPNSSLLVDRSGNLTVGTTDPNTHYLYISKALQGDFLVRVVIHEIGHAALVSFNLIPYIHRMIYPEYWVEAEEFICNFIADYGLYIFNAAREVLGMNAIVLIPNKLERMFL